MHVIRHPGGTSPTWLLLAWLLPSAVSVLAADAPITVRAYERVDLPALDPLHPATASHDLALAVVLLDGTGWTRGDVLDGVVGMAALLGQCGIRLVQLELAEVTAPATHLDLFTARSRELAAALRPPRPTLYFVRDTRQQPAFDAEAIGQGNSGSRPEMTDSVWVTRAAPDLPVVLAHELVHVLTNSGSHVDLPDNLMRDRSDPRHTRLTEAQCGAIQENGTRHGLLTPRDGR